MKTKLTLVATLGALFLLVGCSQSDAQPTGSKPADKNTPDSTIPVEVVQPTRGEMLANYTGTATLEAEADAEVVARVGGEVEKILVEEGMAVRAGQVLAVLDGRQLRLQTAQARAQLAKLERDYKRQIELNQKGLIAANAFEGTKYDLDNLRANYDLAALQLSYTEIRAPFAGVVALRHIKVGQNLQPGVATFRVTNISPLKANVFVPERELRRLKPGQSAAVQVDALPGRNFPARVTLVAPTIDAQTATFKVTLQVADSAAELKPGMFARVAIVFERKLDALAVPRAALLDADGESRLFVVENGVAKQRVVHTGLSESGRVEILSGIAAKDQVVIVGQNGLKDGNPVRIVHLEAIQAFSATAGR
jgi:membrane fusion protein (multidrug efflux system)